MGKYMGRIMNILTGKSEKMELTGNTFEMNAENVKSFKLWWKSNKYRTRHCFLGDRGVYDSSFGATCIFYCL